jgi:hypothetical protein
MVRVYVKQFSTISINILMDNDCTRIGYACHRVDIMLEAKAKEQAVVQYIEQFRITPISSRLQTNNRNV